MGFPGHIRVVPLLAGAVVALAGCAPTRETAAPASPSAYIISRDGGFSYRVPSGWFDVSADSQAQGHAALLIRNDYRATIAVDEVRLDDAARSELRQNGLIPVARLLVSLSSWGHDAVLTAAPHLIVLGGREVCRYALASGDEEDGVEVTLVESRERLYAVRILVSGREGRRNGSPRAVGEDFLETVRW